MLAFCEGDDKTAESWFRKAHDLMIKGGEDPYGYDARRVVGNVAVAVCRASGRRF
jgi:hypothetical protein